MMTQRVVKVVLVSLVFAVAAQANVTNGGFEDDLNAWTTGTYGNARQMTRSSFTSYSQNTLTPVEGDYFYYADAWSPADHDENWAAVAQTVALNEGDVLTGWAAFSTAGLASSATNAGITIIGDPGKTNVWYRDGDSVGDYGFSGWEQWSWEAPAAGDYQIYADVYCELTTGSNTAEFAMDAIGVTSPSPVPAPMALILAFTGLGGQAILRRRLR